MTPDALQPLVMEYLRNEGPRLGLDPGSAWATYQLNAGGFVNASFRIGDRARHYHLKLALDDENRAALRRWHSLGNLLAPYHPPTIVDWIDLGEVAGLVFEVAQGSCATLHGELLDAVLPVLRTLYADRALAKALQLAEECSARDCYLATLHDRFVEDLRVVAATPPPFVDSALLDWMTTEVERLRRDVGAAAAFDEVQTAAVHGDLWLNNILWSGSDDWTLLDWDDVAIGDPALDLATLLGPSADDLTPLKHAERARSVLTDAQWARLPLLGRATLLDWVIDPLADWIEAESVPQHRDDARREKERVHRLALREYRARHE